MKATVVIPVLYSEPQLEDTLRRLSEVPVGLEILIVVDVPDPAREEGARSSNDLLADRFGAVVLYRVGERGFGSALRAGFSKASGDVLIPFMGDECDAPGDIPKLLDRIARGSDVVAGSRYMRGGRIVGNTAKQRLSRFYSWLMRLVGGLPIHDSSNAFKAYRREVIERVDTEAESFDFSVELTVKAHRAGFRIAEVPTTWTNRRLGSSNFGLRREVTNYGRWLLLAIRNRRGMQRRVKDGSR